MNLLTIKNHSLPAAMILSLGLLAGWVRAGSAAQPAAALPAKSVFTLPASPAEGRDPFFPNSLRPYQSDQPVAPQKVEMTSLKLVGISGTSDHRLVIINNVTFAEGDEQDVAVPGGRLHVRCLKIGTTSAWIQAGGQTHELIFPDQQ